ncbi:hypothetical protein [Microbacterium tumbae]
MHRITLCVNREVSLSQDASIEFTDRVRGIAHQQPTLAEVVVLDEELCLTESLAARAEAKAAAMTLTYKLDGVRVITEEMIYEVVPERGSRGAVLAYYAEMSTSGHYDFRSASPLNRADLAAGALAFLESDALGGFFEMRERRRVRRPDDETLLRYVRAGLTTEGSSARRVLSRVFGVPLKTADDWITYARALPDAADLPAPRRGRPRKPQG